jgi:hypothetical protein
MVRSRRTSEQAAGAGAPAPAPPPRRSPRRATRLTYGTGKYAAFHLLLARAFRHHAPQDEVYQYVTLGGTELRDVRTVHFIDPHLTDGAVSFEEDPARFALAQATAERLLASGPLVTVEHDSLFAGFRRPICNRRHLFFVDFEARCAFSDYDRLFGRMFRRGYILENDILLITSFIGGRQRRERMEKEYDPEFRILNVQTARHRYSIFRECHPSFTLYRALREADLQDQLAVECFGFVAYLDSSPMGVYGYTIRGGRTDLRAFLNAPRFELYGRTW